MDNRTSINPLANYDWGNKPTMFVDPSLIGNTTGDASNSWNKWTGDNGYLGTGAGILNAGINAYTGIKGLGLAQDQFDFQKDAWAKNFAMMQDQYYRKLNKDRANRAYYGMSTEDRAGKAQEIENFYDSGTNMQGANNQWSPNPAPVNGPTAANAQMMATSSPFNLQTKQAALGAPGQTLTPGAGDPTKITAGLGNVIPVTAAGSAMLNTNVNPKGEISKRVKKRNPQHSNDNPNDNDTI